MEASAGRDVAATATAPVAVICGGGTLPFAVADSAVRQGRDVVLFPIRGWADPTGVVRYRHHWLALGQFGRGRRLAAAEGCRQVVFIGSVIRPALHEIRLDWQTIRLLPRIARLYRGGDDQLLSGIGQIFQEHGFSLIGAHDIASDIVVPPGPVGGLIPTADDNADIARGLAVLSALGPYDIGQAVVVARSHVLAVEAAEGTDNLLARVAELRKVGRIRSRAGTGVLVKAPKPGQDRRLDLPAIGPQTVAGVIRAGLAGLAVVAGGAIMAEPERVAAAADAGGVFVVGISPPSP
jgi:UDP-2,3-diacylglucosamine hydrolase